MSLKHPITYMVNGNYCNVELIIIECTCEYKELVCTTSLEVEDPVSEM